MGKSIRIVLLGAVALVLGAGPASADFDYREAAYHTTMFDIIFCYLAAPAAGFFAAGSNQARQLLRHLPF